MATQAAVDSAVAQVSDRLRIEDFGGIRVLDVEGELSRGSEDEPVIRFLVTVSDPPRDAETWPIEDVRRLVRRVFQLIAEQEDELPPPIIALQPETPDQADGDEDEPEEGLADALELDEPE